MKRIGALRAACAGIALTVATGACSSTQTTHPSVSPTERTSHVGTSRSTAALHTPGTLANGSFPTVLDPKGDGSLADARVSLKTVAHADAPTTLVARPGHPDQLFLAERAGRVRLVTIDSSTRALEVHAGALTDLSASISTDGEKGLLGLAFDRAGSTLYLSYNVHNGDSRVDSAPITDRNGVPHIGKRTNLLKVDQMGTDFHKGGDLAVDDHDLLYAGFGDGGPQNDEDHHAQNRHLLLGKILRVDPKHPSASRPYGIPDGNPYADGTSGAPEIYLTGLRNPWRFTIDPGNGDLWIGDVGQDKREEIDRLPASQASAGANMGWSAYEGTAVFEDRHVDGPTVPPILELSHSQGYCAVTGGVVYRGSGIPSLRGAYLFADLCRAGVQALRATTPSDGIGRVTDNRLLAGTSSADQIIAFGTDSFGEVYLLSLNGSIQRIEAVG